MKDKKKIDEMNYIKFRNLCSIKHTLKRVEKGKPMNRRGCHQKAFLYAKYSEN